MTTAPVDDDAHLDPERVAVVRGRTRGVLIAGQSLAGIGMGAALSAGALLVTQVSSSALSGLAATSLTVGAGIASVPLAALAARAGRAPALATGAAVAAAGGIVGLVAVGLGSLPLLLAALALMGVGTAVNLQSRFAATDLSTPDTRGRDLALVVWSTTIGAIAGPNLISPADSLGTALGLPELSGVFLFPIAAQALAAVLYLIGLRPDPLRLAQEIGAKRPSGAPVGAADRSGVRTGIVAVALSHAMMVAVMSMTPVHLVDHGATLTIVGLTISLHVAGMYALSPLWGWLSDRVGRVPVIATGQAVLLASLAMTSFGAESSGWVVAGLILLGLGWSASTVAGSALIAESADPLHRTRVQGRADLAMSAAGALGGGLAGPVLFVIGYAGLSLAATALAVVVLVALVVHRARATPAAPLG